MLRMKQKACNSLHSTELSSAVWRDMTEKGLAQDLSARARKRTQSVIFYFIYKNSLDTLPSPNCLLSLGSRSPQFFFLFSPKTPFTYILPCKSYHLCMYIYHCRKVNQLISLQYMSTESCFPLAPSLTSSTN